MDTHCLKECRGLKTKFFHMYSYCGSWTQPCIIFQCIGPKNYYESLYKVKISLHTRYDIGVDKKYDLYYVQHHLNKVMAVYKRAIS